MKDRQLVYRGKTMKVACLLFIAILILTNMLYCRECPKAPLLCKKDGQYCKRWNGQVGQCVTLYDIKGHAHRSCEPFEVDRFGYPDRGYFWPGRDSDILVL